VTEVPSDAAASLILASGSPRRRELLDLLGILYRAQPADIEEQRHEGESPAAYAVRAAREKALVIAGPRPALPVLAADTVVEIDDDVLGKPGSTQEAKRMLRRLSGVTHAVHTGMALAATAGCSSLVDTASVRFQTLTDDIIAWYVATGEPMDKAGAYAVQGAGGLLVDRVEGSPHTVIGLALHRLPELFAGVGLDFRRLLRP
jgi:septum formation protein